MYDARKNKNNYYSREQIHSKLNFMDSSTNGLPYTKETVQRKTLKVAAFLKVL
jgi:hypothetical protein